MHPKLYWGQRFVVSIVFELRTEVVSIYGTEGWSVLYCGLPLPLWAHLLPKVYLHCNHPSACQSGNPFIRSHDRRSGAHRAEPCLVLSNMKGAVTVTMNDPALVVVADSARIHS